MIIVFVGHIWGFAFTIKAAMKDYYDRHGIAYDESLFPAAHDCAHCGE